MPGRHRARTARRIIPSAIAAFTACALVATLWLTGVLRPGEQLAKHRVAAAAAQLHIPDPPKRRNFLPESVPKQPPTTSSTTTPPPTTTQPPSTTTTTPERTTQEPEPAPTTTVPRDTTEPCSTSLEGTRPHVAQVGHHLTQQFGIDSVGGAQGRSSGDHGRGLALDMMVDTATGNNVAEYVLAHQGQFAVKYVIWRQRINSGSGWEYMEDRGGPTANHYDHVHVSFEAGADVNVSC